MFGVRVFADETHHGTLPSTFVSAPARRAVLAGKAIVGAAVAFATCVATYAFVVPITLFGVARRDLPMTTDVSETVALFGRLTLAMVLMTLLGIALASIMRNRAVALVACVLWLSLAENMMGSLLRIPKLLPGAVVRGLVSGASPDGLAAAPAAALLAGFAATAFAAALLTLRRDVA
jgi:ABC-type transport system involved in multi-copper enzyme maturation permease subunit